nr:MAG TPA: hypothetical protein [Caudoviricetes sp.]
MSYDWLLSFLLYYILKRMFVYFNRQYFTKSVFNFLHRSFE